MNPSQFVPLDAEMHRHLGVIEDAGFSHSERTGLVSIGLHELFDVASCMPVVLIDDNASAGVLSAMLGFNAEQNLFCQHGQWLGHAVPVHLRSHPFALGVNNGQLALLVDVNSSGVAESGGIRLFASDGSLMPYSKQVKGLLEDLMLGYRQAQRFVERLSHLGLLAPLTISVHYTDGNTQRIDGCHSINEQVFMRLSSDQLLALHQEGYLMAINAMMLSLRQFNRLVQLSKTSPFSVASVDLQVLTP